MMTRGQTSAFGSAFSSPLVVLIGLLLVGYLLAEAGYAFLALLAVTLGVLMFVGGGSSSNAAPGYPSSPSGIPPMMQIQTNWAGPVSGEESVGKRLGTLANFVGATASKMMGGKPSV
jgi:hypothetical protein